MYNNFVKHMKFENRISDELFSDLNNISKFCNGDDQVSLECLISDLNIISRNEISSNDKRMKLSIYYIRYCSLIENLLMEYGDDVELGKKVITYYIKSNSMMEMDNIGLGWYYDVKYKKDTATLYSVGYGSASNWFEWIQNKNVEMNKIKENGIQLIFTACKEHINRGGGIRLKSLSKCFGVDLFKYMQLDDNCNANLYIIRDAPINYLKINDMEISLQEYLISDNLFDVNSKPQFCLDLSKPRNGKIENYNDWSKRFLQNSKYISQAELDEKKKSYGAENDQLDYFIFEWLKQEHVQEGERAISSRISPIADKEVIVSDTLWSIESYNTTLMKEDFLSEKCYHFSFDSVEYCQLIYYYFKKYAENHSKQEFITNYNKIIEFEKDNIRKMLFDIEKKQRDFNILIEKQLQVKDREKIENQYEDNEKLLLICNSYMDFLENIIIEEPSLKIQLVLSFIDWTLEEIPKNWSLSNIYGVKFKKEENFKINLYKCICKRTALMGV